MKRLWIAGVVVAALVVAAPAGAEKAVPSVAYADAAGDVSASNGPENARDVVKLSLGSDGTNLLVTATLAQDEKSTMAGAAVRLYFDTDDKAATGGKIRYGQTGFEYAGGLYVCHGDGDRIYACAGGGDGKAPKSRHARAALERFKGKPGQQMWDFDATERLYDGFGLAKEPLQGRTLAIKFPYADIGAKSGQVVRVLALEADANDEGLFPEVRLALK